MMRIKEAVQRRRLIQEMNDEWNAHEEENADAPSPIGITIPHLLKEIINNEHWYDIFNCCQMCSWISNTII